MTDKSFTFARASRLKGFRAAVAEINLAECPVFEENSDKKAISYSDIELFEVGRRAAGRLLETVPRPTAIVALNDMIAVGILSELRQRDISIPNDISLVGIDDIVLSRLTTPRLTTICQPLSQIAETAVDRLIARLSAPTRPSAEVVFQPELVVRQSTAGASSTVGMDGLTQA